MSAATSVEWLAAGSCGVGAVGLLGLAMAFVDADPADFDPRPMVRRAIESGRIDPLLVTVVNARHDARLLAAHAQALPRATALTVAAVLALLLPTPGSTR